MKVWLIVLMFLLPLAFSAGAAEDAVDGLYTVEVPLDSDASSIEPLGAHVDVATWLAMLVGWVGLLILESRINDGLKQVHQKLDALERYVNMRDNLLALRLDELSDGLAADHDEPRERRPGDRRDDWKPQRRH